MGYYTRFTLKTENDNEVDPLLDDTRAKATLKQMSGYNWDDDTIDHECKWYDWEEHLTKVSEDFPDVIFILSGEGEEQGDVWNAYARNGVLETFSANIADIGKPAWMGGDTALHSAGVLFPGDDHSYDVGIVKETTVAYSASSGRYFEYTGDGHLSGDEIAVKMKVFLG